MYYAWCSELLNFGICRYHSVKFINHLFVKIIILYKPHPKKVISKNGSKMTFFYIPSDLFSWFCTKETQYTFSTRTPIKISWTFSSIIKNKNSLILYKWRKLKLHFVKSHFILIKIYIFLTHAHGLILYWRHFFWVPQPYTSPVHTFSKFQLLILYCDIFDILFNL
jgi:hypothetical protein